MKLFFAKLLFYVETHEMWLMAFGRLLIACLCFFLAYWVFTNDSDLIVFGFGTLGFILFVIGCVFVADAITGVEDEK